MTNTVTITESNNTVSILEDAPVVTPDPWFQNLRTVPTSSGSATATAGGTSHTKGAWTEIIASNAAETSALFISVSNVFATSTNTATLIDVGTGAAGSETVIAGNIAVGGAYGYYGIQFVLPVRVASGTRIAVRTQALIASDTADVEIDSFALGDASVVPTTVDVLGTSTGNSEGTLITTSYTEVVASTSQEYAAIIAVPSNSGNIVGAGDTAVLSVATGASGSETEIARQNYVISGSGEYVQSSATVAQLDETTIPAGTRLAAKRIGGYNSDCCLIGVPAS